MRLVLQSLPLPLVPALGLLPSCPFPRLFFSEFFLRGTSSYFSEFFFSWPRAFLPLFPRLLFSDFFFHVDVLLRFPFLHLRRAPDPLPGKRKLADIVAQDYHEILRFLTKDDDRGLKKKAGRQKWRTKFYLRAEVRLPLPLSLAAL